MFRSNVKPAIMLGIIVLLWVACSAVEVTFNLII